jgi:hypothetical protein
MVEDRIETVMHTSEFTADLIVKDMQRNFGSPTMTCQTCGRIEDGEWVSIKTGWPQCHGETMLVRTGPNRYDRV